MASLTTRISDRLNRKTGKSSALNRVVMLQLAVEVNEAIESGWSVLTIYKVLYEEGKVTFTYQTFRRYVNKLIIKNT